MRGNVAKFLKNFLLLQESVLFDYYICDLPYTFRQELTTTVFCPVDRIMPNKHKDQQKSNEFIRRRLFFMFPDMKKKKRELRKLVCEHFPKNCGHIS